MKKKLLNQPHQKTAKQISDSTVKEVTSKRNGNSKLAIVISIAGLLIALVGGIPGIISWIQYNENKPQLSFKVDNVLIGTTGNTSLKRSTILLSGRLTNSGEKPLTPSYFKGQIMWDNHWENIRQAFIPIESKFLGEFQDFEIKNAESMDLQKYSQKIMPMTPVYGHLLFYSEIERYRLVTNGGNLKFKITCIDIIGKEYSCIVDMSSLTSAKKGDGFENPKLNIKAIPKQ